MGGQRAARDHVGAQRPQPGRLGRAPWWPETARQEAGPGPQRSRGEEARDVVESGDSRLERPATLGCVTLGKALPSLGFWGTVGGA